jgi:hypothetical protein
MITASFAMTSLAFTKIRGLQREIDELKKK